MIFNIQKYSLHDGPGIRTVVFLKGCPLTCFWCCNPESQNNYQEIKKIDKFCIGCYSCYDICPVAAINENIEINRESCTLCNKCTEVCNANALQLVGKWMSVKEVIREIERDRIFYRQSSGGITLSGGEPTQQTSFCVSLLSECKKNNIHTAIETCGYVRWKSLEKIIEYTDLIFYDLKHMNSEKHKEFTGVGNELILENIKKLSDFNLNIVIRMPLIINFNADKKNINKMGSFIKEIGLKRIELIPYHKWGKSKYGQLGRIYPAGEAEKPSDVQINKIIKILEKYNLSVKIQGMDKNKGG